MFQSDQGKFMSSDDKIKTESLSDEGKRAIHNIFENASIVKEEKKKKKPFRRYRKKENYKQKYLELLAKWKKLTD